MIALPETSGLLKDIETFPALITSEGQVTEAKRLMKESKTVIAFVETEVKRLSAPLKAELDRIKQLGKDISAPFQIAEEGLRTQLKNYEIEKERARQEAARVAARKAQAERERQIRFGQLRAELETKASELAGTEKEAAIVDWLSAKKYKPEAYGDNPEEVHEYMNRLLARIQSGLLSRIQSGKSEAIKDAELKAEFAAAIVEQVSQQAAPQKSSGTYFKDVWIVERSEAYVALLSFYIQNGGSMEKLDFLSRFAEKTGMTPPAGVRVEKVPIVRV